jgi:hypothetical protein
MDYNEWLEAFILDLRNGHADLQTDNEGQLVIYTNMYRHEDGTIHNVPENPSFEDSPCPITEDQIQRAAAARREGGYDD